MKTQNLISTPISLGDYQDFISEIVELSARHISSFVCVANVHMQVKAYRNKNFRQMLSNANIVTPDGMPLTWALRLLYGIKQDRVAGMNLLPDLLRTAENHHLPVYFYGGTPDMLFRTQRFLWQKYPDLVVAGTYSPPFRNLTEQEKIQVIEEINSTDARLVFVVLGCPKQEKWMADMKGKINATMIGIGGALPVLIGQQKRAPVWMQSAGLEWLFRFSQEPKRLFKRYAVTNTVFMHMFIIEYIRIKILRKPLHPEVVL